MTTIEEYNNLCDQIIKWNTEYYVENAPTISDAEYDQHLKRLQQMEAAHPAWKRADSPSWQVGGKFGSVCGLTSQQKMFSPEEIIAWRHECGKVSGKSLEVVAEPKIDGCTLAITYKNGKAVKATLRDSGNGENDVTDKIKYIAHIPLTIPYTEEIQVRGEACILNRNFDMINANQKKLGLKTYANPRNLCAGTLQADDPKLCQDRYVVFVTCGFDRIDSKFKSYCVNMGILETFGFWIVPHKMCSEDYRVADRIAMYGVADDFPYPMDGVVFKIDDMSAWRTIGTTEHHPKYMTAYKYPTDSEYATLLSVDWQVAASGKITPVANFTPVHLHKTVVQRATMNNPQWIIENLGDLHIGDKLLITKANEIIPKIVGVKHVGTGVKVELIDRCPMCGKPLYHHTISNGDRSKDVFCDNNDCESRTVVRTKQGKVSKSGVVSDTSSSLPVEIPSTLAINASALVGKNVVVSGTFNGDYSRAQLEAMIPQAGGKHTSSVSGKTSFIVAGDGMGPSKRVKAEQMGVEIIDWKTFVSRISK